MRLLLFLACFAILPGSVFAQQKRIEVTHPDIAASIIFKEGERIRLAIRGAKRKRISGKFTFSKNLDSIYIKKYKIAVKDIIKIKKHAAYMYPLSVFVALASSQVLTIGLFAFSYTAPYLGPTFVSVSIFSMALLGSYFIIRYCLVRPINFMKAYKTRKNWTLKSFRH